MISLGRTEKWRATMRVQHRMSAATRERPCKVGTEGAGYAGKQLIRRSGVCGERAGTRQALIGRQQSAAQMGDCRRLEMPALERQGRAPAENPGQSDFTDVHPPVHCAWARASG